MLAGMPGRYRLDAAPLPAVAEAGHADDPVLGIREFVIVSEPGEEELGPVVGRVWLVGEPEGELVLIWSDLDDAQGVFGETTDLAAGEKDRGLQQRLLRAAGCGLRGRGAAGRRPRGVR
jgi:hypothetical protein